MKHIINFLGVLFAVVFIGVTFTACSEDDEDSANVGLGIKVFFPTKVVTNQPMTINGSGFNGVTEIEFPGGTKVTDFEIVSGDMIRVNAPAGIAADGGKIIVRTANDEAESRQSLTLGHTNVTGFSKQPGETATGGELITVFGTDLEFINGVELLDADSVPQMIDHKDFYRKGTNEIKFHVPLKNIYKGTFVGYLYTYDGQKIPMPELAYEPSSTGGHMELVKTIIWKNNNGSAISWSSLYRFALEGHDGNSECIAEIPQDIWNRMMTETFYLTVEATDPQIRVTNGWWDAQWQSDFQPGNERLTDNGDGTWTLAINLTDSPDFIATLEQKHILFTGDRYTPVDMYFEDEIWVDGGGHMENVKTSVWKNNNGSAISWSSLYRFALEGHDGNNECIAEIPQDLWDKMMTETFYLDVQATDPQIRVTNGWWDVQWLSDFQPGNERLTDNGDGTWTLAINLTDSPDFVATLEQKHILFTGDRYTPLEIYFAEEVWVDGGGDSGSSETVFWQNSGAGAVSWSSQYRFALEGHDGNNECIAEFPQDVWDKIKTETFYLVVEATDPQIRVTNGWWDTQWLTDFQPGNALLTDNGDGTWTLEINIAGDPLADTIDQKHILFTGDRFTPVKLFFK